MPDSSVALIGKDATGKLKTVAMKTNKKAIAYLVLAFKNIMLLHLVTKAMTNEWPGEKLGR